MMWSKAMLFNDFETAALILETADPKKQKALGKLVENFNSATWDTRKLDIVIEGNFHKFTQNAEMKRELLSTGDKILVEGSPYDTIWGVGLKYTDDLILDEKNWRGENLLGVALMTVRENLRKSHK